MSKRSEEYMTMRRQQILDAAMRVFLKKGIHQTSMRDICKESGMSIGAVYNHYSSKQELIFGYAEQALAAKPPLTFDTLEVFRDHTLSKLQNITSEWEKYVVLDFQIIEEGLRDDRVRSTAVKALQMLVDDYRSCMQHLAGRGEINSAYDIETGSHGLVSQMFSVLVFYLIYDGELPSGFADSVEAEFSRMQKQ